MSAPTLNIPLAKAVLKQITEHPETHNQNTWGNECGTEYCIAGWALVLTPGAELRYCHGGCGCGGLLEVALPGKDWESTSSAAREVLGLDRNTASRLFATGPNANAREYLVELIASAGGGDR